MFQIDDVESLEDRDDDRVEVNAKAIACPSKCAGMGVSQ